MPIQVVSPIQIAARGRRHSFSCSAGELGALEVLGRERARFVPAEGLPLSIRREPGITASHYQMWNDRGEQVGEFFASSYRWSVFTRTIRVHYGNNDYVLVPKAGLGLGYELTDNKGKRILTFTPASMLGGRMSVTLDKAETELPCIVFAYYLARTTWLRSLWPAKREGAAADAPKPAALDAATQNAHAKAAELAKAMMPGTKPAADAPAGGAAPPAAVAQPSKDAAKR